MLRKTEDIVHKVEGCQDLVQLSPPLPSVSAAMASSTGLTLPVALVATGAVVGTGATTAMTAPVATRATPRPSTRRVWRAYVHDHPRRARRPSLAALVARAPAAPPRSLRRRVHPPHRRRPAGRCSPPGGHQAATWRTAATRCRGSARGSTLTPSTRRSQPGPYGQPRVPVCAACVCAPTRLPVTLLPRTVAGRCRGRPGCARQLAAARDVFASKNGNDRKRHVPIRDPIMWKKEENLRVSTEENFAHMLDLRMCFKRASGFDFSSTKT